MQFSLFDLVMLLGIFQGLIIGTLLFISKKNQQSNRFLALGLFSFCLLSTKPLLHSLALWETNFFGYFPNALELAVAPLFFFYVKSLITPDFKFRAKDWLHFLPFFISQGYAFVVYFFVFSIDDVSLKYTVANDLFFNEVKQFDEYIMLVGTIIYLFMCLQLLKAYKKWLNETSSDNKLPDFNWLKLLLRLFGFAAFVLLVGRILFLSLRYDSIWLEYFWKFMNLYIAFLIYFLGLKGFLLPQYKYPTIQATNDNLPLGLNEQSLENQLKIEAAMKIDKVFLDMQLSIQTLSKHLDLPQREVSRIINRDFKTNFRDFVNHHRIEEVKTKLKNPENSNMSILGIALESGFSSETSFYRLFKKYVGMTPKQFIDQQDQG